MQKLEYRRPILVDANVIGVLPREVVVEAMILTNSLHGVSLRDLGKEPRHNRYMPFMGGRTEGTLETFPAYMSVSGISQGQPSYQHALHDFVVCFVPMLSSEL